MRTKSFPRVHGRSDRSRSLDHCSDQYMHLSHYVGHYHSLQMILLFSFVHADYCFARLQDEYPMSPSFILFSFFFGDFRCRILRCFASYHLTHAHPETDMKHASDTIQYTPISLIISRWCVWYRTLPLSRLGLSVKALRQSDVRRNKRIFINNQ